MRDKRRVIMATLMLTLIVGQAGALTLIDYLMPVVLGPIGIIGYWLGLQKSEEYQQLIADYEAQLTSNTIQNSVNTRLYLQEIYTRDQNIYSFGQDISEYTKNYAWALAKYTLLKALSNGSTLPEAKALAKQEVEKYYQNITASIIANQNETNKLLWHVIETYANTSGLDTLTLNATITDHRNGGTKDIVYKFDPSSYTWTSSWVYFPGTYESRYLAEYYLNGTKTITAVNKTYSLYIIQLHLKHSYYDGLGTQVHYHTEEVDKATLAGNEIYNNTEFYNAINAIDSAYNYIMANLDAYADALFTNVDLSQFNITDYIDPYILAGLLNNDFNQTGYYGYAAAELALLGFNTTGINKTITITVYEGNNTTTLEGWLFTDWTGTLEKGQNYTANGSYKWFFVADGGIYDLSGYNFTVEDLRDWQGKPLTNITLIPYASHSGDVLKVYDELAQIRQLYEEYINNLQAMAAGSGSSGSGFNLSEWWASLDQTAKIGVIAIGAVGVFALLRRD